MVEATPSLTHAQRQAQRQAIAVQVLAMHAAKREVKEQIRRQGKVKLPRVPARVITAMARERVMEDAAYRARLIAQARPIVEQWSAEGFFGKRAAQRQLERNLQHLHKPGSAEPQPLLLCETHDRNGAVR